jgi:hypothetical protein
VWNSGRTDTVTGQNDDFETARVCGTNCLVSVAISPAVALTSGVQGLMATHVFEGMIELRMSRRKVV